MKAIMYHYVRPFDKKYPKLKSLEFDNFRKQLDFFEKEYGFCSKEEFDHALVTGETNEKIILTFDDGLSCHYEFVFKELLERNLWGIFYVNTNNLLERKIINVHRIHILLSKFNAELLLNETQKIISDNYIDKSLINDFEKFTYGNQSNDNFTLKFKRILNYYISYEHRSLIIDKLMQKFGVDEDKVFNDFYMSKENILEMHDNGMIIGNHSKTHPVFSKLNEAEQREEITSSFDYLSELLGEFKYKTFCYPYGGFHSFNNKTVEILNENKCQFSFNVESRSITAQDLIHEKQKLPRFDCNEFEYGKVIDKIFY
jgi:peptidoglycan/xylan/chitin deacetylase (PgdA/CDA1 family)